MGRTPRSLGRLVDAVRPLDGGPELGRAQRLLSWEVPEKSIGVVSSFSSNMVVSF